MAGHGRTSTHAAALIAALLLGACDASPPAANNAATAASATSLRDQLFAAAEPCVTKVDALLDDVNAKSITGEAVQRAARAAAAECDRARDTVLAVGAPARAVDACRTYVADNSVVADLTGNAERVPSRNSRDRLQEALARRDRSRDGCAAAAAP